MIISGTQLRVYLIVKAGKYEGGYKLILIDTNKTNWTFDVLYLLLSQL